MSVLVYIDINEEGAVKKSAAEAMTYGSKLAAMMGVNVDGVALSPAADDMASLGKYGLKKIHRVQHDNLKHFDAQLYSDVVAEVAQQTGATVIVFSNNTDGKAMAPRLSAKLKAGLVAGAVALPEINDGFTVKKSVFSGKAFAHVKVLSPVKIITLNPNAFPAVAGEGVAEIVPFSANVETPAIKVVAVKKASGEVPLAEAEIVVSGGRGLKGPENWGIIEELAHELHAGLACSRPVADAHWRPHNEHVGQTGGAIAPNLYIACGISGAIQHLAGVNRSKVIVVINKDPEAPFFKAADYGIVGDLFEVVPKMTEAIRQLRN